MRIALAVTGALGLCALSCARFHLPPIPPGLAPVEIYQRATNQFAQADFYKPAESKTNEPAFALAPLILQEVEGAGEPLSQPDRFGTLSLSNGLWALDPSRPSVYWHADTVTLSGRSHARLAYWWFYSLGSARSASAPYLQSSGQREGGLMAQGLRLTLNSAGQPAIWEVLADSSGAGLVFVSQSLEAAAAARFGKALPGRRYAVERSVQEAPKAIVARVIDDGPVAMGPIVYLSAGTRSVSTLICRCMPAQAKTLRTTATYDLLPLPAAASDLLSQTPGTEPDSRPNFWAGDVDTDNRLEQWLRLPGF